MISTLFFLVGLCLTVLACVEIGTSPLLSKKKKVLYIILMAISNWIGIFVYIVFGRKKIRPKNTEAVS